MCCRSMAGQGGLKKLITDQYDQGEGTRPGFKGGTDIMGVDLGIILTLAFFGFAILIAAKSVAIVPQSDEYVVERFGKYRQTLSAGISLLIPFLDRIEHKVVVL